MSRRHHVQASAGSNRKRVTGSIIRGAEWHLGPSLPLWSAIMPRSATGQFWSLDMVCLNAVSHPAHAPASPLSHGGSRSAVYLEDLPTVTAQIDSGQEPAGPHPASTDIPHLSFSVFWLTRRILYPRRLGSTFIDVFPSSSYINCRLRTCCGGDGSA
ncbi:hypothetical protein M8818_005505 [Zalaria obscura]|uniref:Uncharacterized protein n=1 Tax=Zalaria obscura TaxID=2024903 RepID=A0ACC3SA00_9PEZI